MKNIDIKEKEARRKRAFYMKNIDIKEEKMT